MHTAQMDYFLKTYPITKQLQNDPGVRNNHTHLLGYQDDFLITQSARLDVQKPDTNYSLPSSFMTAE